MNAQKAARTPGETPPGRPEPAFFQSIRSSGLTRSPNRVVAGVVGGVAGAWGMSTGVLRLLTFIGGIIAFPLVVTAYIVGWVLLPDPAGRIILEHEDFTPGGGR